MRLVGYDKIPSVLPQPPAGRGLTAGSDAAPRRCRARWPAAGLHRGAELARSWRRRCTTTLGLPADDPRRAALRLVNPLSEDEPRAAHLAAARACSRSLLRNVGRGERDLAIVRDRAGVPHASATRRRRPSRASTHAADRRRDRRARRRRCPTSRATSAPCCAATSNRAGWWGAARAADLGRRRRGRPGRRPRGARRARRARGATRAVAPGPLCRAAARRRRWSATPASCTRA